MAKLNNLLQVGVSLKAELITWVEVMKLWNQLLEECLSGNVVILIVADNSLGREEEASGA